jgi:LacI family transcriptional regulator
VTGGERRRRVGSAPTLADVAARAEVSVSTAARVLRNPDTTVDPALAARVRVAAEELDYVPNVLARTLRGGGPTMVGLVVGDMLDPYYGAIAESITEAAESEHSMVAIVSNMQRSPELELKHCRQLWGHRVSGLILAGGGFDQWTHFAEFERMVTQIRSSGVAVVSLSPRGVDLPTFCVDNVRVGALMAERLLADGHRRIGVLVGPARGEVTQQRLRGATAAIEAAGGEFVAEHGDYSAAAGAQLIRKVIADHPELTGFVAGSDSMAIGVIAGLTAAGLRVPEDVSVVSTGNTQMAGWSSPPLTTVDVRLADCGRAALSYVAAHVGQARKPAARALVPRLVEGGSVAAVRPESA